MKIILVGLICAASVLAQTFTLTSPASSSAQSGIINLTVTNVPAATEHVDYMLDGHIRVARIQRGSNPTVAMSPYSGSWNTGEAFDGSDTMQAIAYDVFGTQLAASATNSFTVNNFGITYSITSPNPAVNQSGTINLTSTGNQAGNLTAVTFNVDGLEVCNIVSMSYPSGTNCQFDTTQVPDGPHLVSSIGLLTINGAQVPRMASSFVITTVNGHALMGVKPDVTDMVLNVGDTYQLAPEVAYTDGTTGAGTFTYSLMHACVPPLVSQNVPFPCVSGLGDPVQLETPAPGAQGAAYVSVSAGGLITALAKGHSIVIVTDSVSGKKAEINIAVKQYKTVPHIGKDGSILTSYDPAKSIVTTSLFNTGTVNINTETFNGTHLYDHLKQAGFTAFEADSLRLGHGYANYAAWNSAFQANELAAMQTAYTNTGGMTAVLRGEPIAGYGGEALDTAHGPSASWSPSDPLTSAINQIRAYGNISNVQGHDEAFYFFDTFNGAPDCKMSNGSITKIIVGGVEGAGNARWYAPGPSGTNGACIYAGATRYSHKILVRGATTSGLNGLHQVGSSSSPPQWYCTAWNAWYNGAGQLCPQNMTFQTTGEAVAPGTYDSSTDPNLEVLVFGDPAIYPTLSGEGPWENDTFKVISDRLRANNVPIAWPTLGGVDFVANMYNQGPLLANFVSKNLSIGGVTDNASTIASPLGWSALTKSLDLKTRTWGPRWAGHWYWQYDMTGYVHWQQDVPHQITATSTGWDWFPGGRSVGITGFSGNRLTFSSPHSIRPQSGVYPFIKVQISGNSDAVVNGTGKWLRAGMVIDPNTVEVYSEASFPCVSGSGGIVTVRGKPYTITNPSNGAIVLATNLPADLMLGEHITISGNTDPNTCYNSTFAFGGFGGNPPALNFFTVWPFVNSNGTGGTALINDNGGKFNPLYDYGLGVTRVALMPATAVRAVAMGYSGLRWYSYSNIAGNYSLIDNREIGVRSEAQDTACPYASCPAYEQSEWWAMAQANLLIKRLSQFFLGTFQPSPNCGDLGDPWVQCSLMSSAAGKVQTAINFSEVSRTVSVDYTKCQTGSNPISVYHIDYPHFTTELLSGTQGTVNYTLVPGEVLVAACHSSAASFVKNAPVSFKLASVPNSTKVSVRMIYGYQNPLAGYGRAVLCSSSPCNIPVDTGVGNTYLQLNYLDVNNVVLATSDVMRVN